MLNLLPLLLILVPSLGAVFPAMMPDRYAGKMWGIGVSVLTFVLAMVMAVFFDWSAPGPQFIWQPPVAYEGLPTQFKLGVDTLSMMMILLTVVLHPLAITASFRSIQVRTREHYAWMNVLLASMLGVWLARDLLLFYVFFETTLIPLFFIIGIFGGVHRRAAAGRYFLYTFFGSIFLLLGLVYLGVRAGSFDMDRAIAFAQTGLSGTERMLLLYA